jgi:hypothetical protein
MLGYGLAGTTALSLLGGQQRGPGAGQMPDPGMIRPYNYSSAPNEPTGTYPSPYATAEYNEAGNPILDTRERNYFSQGFSPMEPYSAKTGTVNPNIPVTMAARGGLMFDDESGMDEARGLAQGNLQKGLFGMGYAAGGQIKGYAAGGMPDFGNGRTFPNLPPMSGPLGAVGGKALPGSSFNDTPFSNINPNDLQVQGGGYDSQGRPVDGLGNVIERTKSSGQSFGQVMGNLSNMFPSSTATQGGFGQGAQGYPSFNQNPNTSMGGFTGPSSSYGSSNGSSGGAFPLEGKYGIIKMAEGGDVDLDQERNKLIMKNIKSASTKDLEKIMGAMNQQEFLMKNMPNYAQSMSPSISGMVEGAQYGDRMAKAYGGQPRDINVMPTMVDPQSGMYGGIASIGRQIDPDTRVNAMANIFRTPYDRNATDSVRRLGVGVDRQLGKDTNLSAFYEQDPMGRNKMGGARLTQRFEEGGEVKHMFGGGLSAMISKMFENNPEMLTKYEYDKTNQRYSTVPQPQQSQGIFSGLFGGAMGARDTGLPAYRFDPAAQEYQALAAGGHLGGYSDGGRMLKGPGDGMSDDIPGVIGNKQPARLADGEFVVPADVVSHLGNGSTDAGAKRLYAMMDEVRRARTGNKKQGKKIKAEKYLPA